MQIRRKLMIGIIAAALFGAAGPIAFAQNSVTALFAHVAVGGGYTTTFTLLNTGSTSLTGKLILTGQDGKPLTAAFTGPSSFQTTASSIDLNIPIGGTQFWIAGASPANAPTTAGWARVESSGGTLGGVATFQLTSGSTLIAIAGVLAADSVQFATIPVDDDYPSRTTGYAVANPSTTDTLSIKVQMVKADGTLGPTLATIPLEPGKQKAAFLWEDQAAIRQFQGSVVLIEQGGKKFAVVALVQNQNLYTAIPVIPAKAPGIN